MRSFVILILNEISQSFFYIFHSMTGLKFIKGSDYEYQFETVVRDCLKRDDVLLLKCILGVGRENNLQMSFHERKSVLYLARSAGERKFRHNIICL